MGDQGPNGYTEERLGTSESFLSELTTCILAEPRRNRNKNEARNGQKVSYCDTSRAGLPMAVAFTVF